MLPAACLSALLCPLLVWPFAAPLDVSTIDLRKLFLFGTTQFGLGLVFLIQNRGECILHFIRHSITGHQPQQQGLRHRERANQRVQNAAWVRSASFSGAPSIANFTGGMIVMAAVAGHVWHSNRVTMATAAT
jgi:hypothetical protein